MQIETHAPSAMIVPGAASPEIAPTTSNPTGVSPNDPNQSMLITRESMCCGTSSISIVSQTATPKPMQIPRRNAATTANEDHGESANTITSRLFSIQITYEIRPRRRLRFDYANATAPRIIPAPSMEKTNPYAFTPRWKCAWTSFGVSTWIGAHWHMSTNANNRMVTQSHGTPAT